MAWACLVLAGMIEVIFSYALKQSYGFTRPVASVAAIVSVSASLGLLAYAMRTLPLGLAYLVWTGVGGLGALAVGAIVLGEAMTPLKIASAGFVVVGLCGLRFASAG
jgi:quaternary ammonium compound-resistance protein SugE